MKSRLYVRLLIAVFFFGGIVRRTIYLIFRKNIQPKKILICHQLLIGDVMMLFPMIARIRKNHPQAKIYLMSDSIMKDFLSLNPYDCEVVEYDGKSTGHFFALLRRGFFDVVVIPVENKLSYLSVAIGCGDIYAYEGDKPSYKNWMINHLMPFPIVETGLPELFDELGAYLTPSASVESNLSVDNPWLLPSLESVNLPRLGQYVVIHVGARNKLRYWSSDNWLAVASAIKERGLLVHLVRNRYWRQ
jgi:ADP-heptose:LPS heptosyltransferase